MKLRNDQRGLLIMLALIVVLVILFAGQKKTSSTIVDVSWPNCQTAPSTNFRQGILGATGGLDFRPNHCLTTETTWVGHYDLYMNTGYPGRAYGMKVSTAPLNCVTLNNRCLAYNYGFAAADYALHVAAQAGTYTNMWWLDIEADNSWTTNVQINRAVLEGAIGAITQHSFLVKVGVYSTPGQWRAIVGQWHNGLPVWLGTGLMNAQAAAKECKATAFNGGSIWLSQYTTKLDGNVGCSGAFTQRLIRS